MFQYGRNVRVKVENLLYSLQSLTALCHKVNKWFCKFSITFYNCES